MRGPARGPSGRGRAANIDIDIDIDINIRIDISTFCPVDVAISASPKLVSSVTIKFFTYRRTTGRQ